MNIQGKFQNDFLWGTATSSYQVEGAANLDGRGPSIWDEFCKLPGRIKNDHTGDVSCDQYNNYKEDIKLMQWLGLKCYRFSLSWSRIIPKGTGKINQAGIDYYNRLIDELLEYNIQPWVTLFHWDLPLVLEKEKGGWRNVDISKIFADYSSVVSKAYSDRVSHFFTINEIDNISEAGYEIGNFPPGLKLPKKDVNQINHNILVSHGRSVNALRDNAKRQIKIGIAEDPFMPVPIFEVKEQINAAKKAFREMNADKLTAIMEGKYIDSYLEKEAGNAPNFTDEEMKIIASPIDFLGINTYFPIYIRAVDSKPGWEVLEYPHDYPTFSPKWLKIGPQITYWAPRYVKELWNIDYVVISENGCGTHDKLTKNNEVIDTHRIMFLRSHFNSALKAVQEGWPLKGYFVWSLLDNFEWAEGYDVRFGLFYVNHQTQKRIAKLSAHYFKEVIKNNMVV